MGMNFDLAIIPDDVKQSILHAVQNNEFEKARRLLKEHKPIHIGKSSHGWKFIFNHHNWKYYDSLETLQKWLKSGTILTEDGDVCSFEWFWEKVENKQNGRSLDIENFGYAFSLSTNFS